MSNYFNLEGIKTEIEKQIDRDVAILNAWKNVTFPTKKDGSAFKQMGKNISGATYCIGQYSLQPGEYILRVNAWCKSCGYVNDEMNAHNLVKYVNEEKKLKIENHMPKVSYLEQIYCFDLDDIKEAVNNRIEYFEKRVANLTEQLTLADQAYKNFVAAYRAAVEQLDKDAKKANDSTLHYMIMETVKARYPYCN